MLEPAPSPLLRTERTNAPTNGENREPLTHERYAELTAASFPPGSYAGDGDYPTLPPGPDEEATHRWLFRPFAE